MSTAAHADMHAEDGTPGGAVASGGRSSGHNHGVSANADVKYLRIALALIVGFMAVEVVVAVLAKSLALFFDAGHMLSDAGALAASLWAISLAARPATGAWTFGWKRAEILSAAGQPSVDRSPWCRHPGACQPRSGSSQAQCPRWSWNAWATSSPRPALTADRCSSARWPSSRW